MVVAASGDAEVGKHGAEHSLVGMQQPHPQAIPFLGACNSVQLIQGM